MFLSQRGGVERPASGLLASHVATANEARSEWPLIGSFPRLQRLVLRCAREGDRLDRGFCEEDFHLFIFRSCSVTPGRQARAVSLRGPCVYVQVPPPPPPPPADLAPHARSARQERRRRCLARRRALSSAVSRRK